MENLVREEVPKVLGYTYAERGPGAGLIIGCICVHLRSAVEPHWGPLRFLGPAPRTLTARPAKRITETQRAPPKARI